MNTHIVGRGLELTEPIKRYVESAFESIKKYNLDIISASAILSDNKKGEFKRWVYREMFKIRLPGVYSPRGLRPLWWYRF